MSTVWLRPTVAADLAFVDQKPLPYRTRCITMMQGDAVVAVGGLIFRPDGTIWAAAQIAPAGRTARVSLHRLGLRVIDEARAAGIRRIFALADPGVPRAQAWLARLGFAPTDFHEDGKPVWAWQG